MRTKRIFAFALCVILLIGTVPVPVHADDGTAWIDQDCPKAREWGWNPAMHNLEWTTLQYGNCTRETIEQVRCTYCGKSHVEHVPAPGHDWDEGVVTKAATCTQAGSVTYTCQRLNQNIYCGEKRTETIPALGHIWDSGTVTKAATCAEAGVKTYTCTRCGEAKTETIPKLSHAFGAWSTTKAPTCTEAGQRERKCTACGYTEKETIAKTAHTPSEAPAIAPTCTEPGHGAGNVCAVCGETLTEAEAFPALGHLWDGGKVTKLPTETEEGEVTYTCQRDPSHTKTEKLPAAGSDANPKAWLSVSWAEDAGKGKCFEGAKVTVQNTVTNIGNVPITVGLDYHDTVVVTLQPAEEATWDTTWEVRYFHVMFQEMTCWVQWSFKDPNGKEYFTNGVEYTIPLTYPDGTEAPQPSPSVKLEMIPEDAFKDVYPYDDGDVHKAETILFSINTTNNGNVPLDLYMIWIDSYQGTRENYYKWKNVQPGKSKSSPWDYYGTSKRATPDPEDSPYFGTHDIEWYVLGYAVGADPATAKPLCESNHIKRSFKIARPEAEDWTPPEDGIKKEFTKTERSHPSDPNGYQVGETIQYKLLLSYSDKEAERYMTNLTVEDPNASDKTGDGSLHKDYKSEVIMSIWIDAYHTVTQEDVDERGYVTNTAYAAFTDSATGEPVKMESNTVVTPVIGKSSTLLITKALANPPANGAYYTEGEEIEYTIVITNNTDKTYTNIEVKDGGKVIATIEKLEPGESSEPIRYTGGPVTALDQIITVIKNVATVTATDPDGNKEIITSTEVTAPTDPDGGLEYKPDPEKGNDPLGKIDGVVAGVYISKTETSAPANGEWYAEGETITYAITVKNTGEVTATNITVRDSLEKAGLGVIETIASLAPGESRTIVYQHPVTAEDVEHGVVINYATASWQYDGKTGVPVTSEKVKSYTSEKGPVSEVTGGIVPPVKDDDKTPELDPDGKIIEDSAGTPIYRHPDGSYVSCMLDIRSASDSAALYTLRHCREHEAVAKAAAELLEGNEDSLEAWNAVATLWLDAIETAYQDLYDAAWGDAAGALLLAHDRFIAELQYETELLYTTTDQLTSCRRITEILRLHCTELCHMLHGDARTDSLLNVYAELGGSESGETCARSIGEGEAEAQYIETYCEAHTEIMAAVRENLRRCRSDTAEANAFGTGASMWQKALDTMVNAKYKTADADGKKLIAKTRKGLDLYKQALHPLYETVYPDDPAAPEEVTLQLYRTMAVDLCELW